MTRQDEEMQAEKLLAKRRQLARLGLRLGPRDRLLLERLLYRLGWTRGETVNYARPPKFRTSDQLVHHAARVLDNPLDNASFMAFADHLSERYPDDPSTQHFLNWVQGGEFDPLIPFLRDQPHVGAVTQDDIELKPRRVGTLTDQQFNTPIFQKNWHDPHWHQREFITGTHSGTRPTRSRRKISSLEVAHTLNQYGGAPNLVGAVIAARVFHPDRPGGSLYNVPAGEERRKAAKFMQRRVVRYAKADSHLPAHPLVAGFPIEHALRHIANDPKLPGHVRDTAWIALTGKNKLTGETNPDGMPDALWALHDQLQEIDHPLGSHRKGGYNWMSAADKVRLDQHTHTALREFAESLRRIHGAAHNNQLWDYRPEGQAMRIAQALDSQRHLDRTVAARNSQYLDMLHDRVAQLSGITDHKQIDESLRRHAYRAQHVWRMEHGAGATNPGEGKMIDTEYQERARQPLAEESDRLDNLAAPLAAPYIKIRQKNEKATRYAKQYRGLRKFTHWKIPPGWGSIPGPSKAMVEIMEHRPVKNEKGQWIWGGSLNKAVAGHIGPRYETKENAEEALGEKVYDAGAVGGQPLTPEEVWAHTDGKEGTPPKPAEVDWRPEHAIPEDFYANSRRRYARLTLSPGVEVPHLPTGETAFNHTFHDESGKKIGGVKVIPRDKGETLHIPAMGGLGLENQVGGEGVRHIFRGLMAHYPKAKRLTGARISGFRRNEGLENQEVSIPLPGRNQRRRVVVKYAKQLTGTFIDALRRAVASNSDALKQAGEKIARKIGAWPTKTFSALHDTPHGATPGVAQVVYGRTSPEQVHALASWVGLVGNLPGVAVFHARPNGPDLLHRFRAEGSGMDLRTRLDRAGISQRVLIPHGKGFDVLVPDQGGRMQRAVESYAQQQGHRVQTSTGHFNAVGSTDQAAVRDTFRNRIAKAEAKMSRTEHRQRVVKLAAKRVAWRRVGKPRLYATHSDFINKIEESPGGETNNDLVYADFLQEQGMEHSAAFIRHVVEQMNGPRHISGSHNAGRYVWRRPGPTKMPARAESGSVGWHLRGKGAGRGSPTKYGNVVTLNLHDGNDRITTYYSQPMGIEEAASWRSRMNSEGQNTPASE